MGCPNDTIKCGNIACFKNNINYEIIEKENKNKKLKENELYRINNNNFNEFDSLEEEDNIRDLNKKLKI